VSTLYERFLWRVVRASFDLCQTLGFHITLNHHFQPVPDTTRLKEELWAGGSELPGVDLNEKEQLRLLSLFSSTLRSEYSRFPRRRTNVPYEFHFNNTWFESVDAELLYCMIRHFKPTRIMEIGSGYSTYVSAAAIRTNREGGADCELIAIEPYPNATLKAGVPGLAKLIAAEVQEVPLVEFEKLKENDILFIDSSHVVKIGGDVTYEYLEILPRLNRGVLVHVHDIFLPAEYPRDWVLREHLFWNEQYLLRAFLTFNKRIEVLWGSYYMHLVHPDELEAAFDSYDRNSLPASFWIRVVG